MTIKEKIFRNILTLSFKDQTLEEKYKKSTNLSIAKYNKLLIPVFLAIAVTGMALIYDKWNKEKDLDEIHKNVAFAMFISYIVICLSHFVLLILSISVKNLTFHILCNYYNYLVLIFTFSFIKYYIAELIHMNFLTLMAVFTLEFIIRMIFILLGMINCIEALILGTIMTVFCILYGHFLNVREGIVLYHIIYYALCLIITIVAYCITYERKRCYYFIDQSEVKNKWYDNLINNMNTGFVLVKNNTVSFINKILLAHLKKIDKNKENKEQISPRKTEHSHQKSEHINMLTNEKNNFKNNDHQTNLLIHIHEENINNVSNSDGALWALLSDISLAKVNQEENANEDNKSSEGGFNPESFFAKLKIEYNQYKENQCDYSLDNFIHLGNKKYQYEEEGMKKQIFFEVSYRFYKNNYLMSEPDNFEFIFNNVTITKLREEKNAEFKYKSLYLSKITHEFKNPLICITELVDQIADYNKTYNNTSSTQFSLRKPMVKTLSLIKSLSDYLLILIKDLDYFSHNQIEKNDNLDYFEVNIVDILKFCKQVAKGLMKKNGKSEVKFKIIKDENIPITINSDEIKLKQILINLISNSIKFTNKGVILLKVTMEIDMLKFSVSDTGKGMNNSQMENLFKPFRKGNDADNSNRFGAGLGLSIVMEITKKLGGILDFSSKTGEGSIFWFTLPVDSVYLPAGDISVLKMNTKQSFFPILKDDTIANTNTNITHQTNIERLSLGKFLRYKKSDITGSIKSRFTKTSSINFNNTNKLKTHDIFAKKSCFNNNQETHEVNSSTETVKVKDLVLLHKPTSFLSTIISSQGENNQININQNTYNNIKISNNDCYDNEDPVKEIKHILVIDDEPFTRQSTVRMLGKVAEKYNINLKIIEADDGIECIYNVYKLLKNDIKIYAIISDETMHYLNGSKTALILGEILGSKNIPKIPYYLLTAYEGDYTLKNLMNKHIEQVFTKPLRNVNAELLFRHLNNSHV